MKEYTVTPEFRYGKAFLSLSVLCQLVAVGCFVLGCVLSSVGFLLGALFQLCALYDFLLYLCNRNYRLYMTSETVRVQTLFGRSKVYSTETLQWKIRTIPWYNEQYLLLYSSRDIPIAILKPLWKNTLQMLRFPHCGKLNSREQNYLKFLKTNGLLGQDVKGRFYAIR